LFSTHNAALERGLQANTDCRFYVRRFGNEVAVNRISEGTVFTLKAQRKLTANFILSHFHDYPEDSRNTFEDFFHPSDSYNLTYSFTDQEVEEMLDQNLHDLILSPLSRFLQDPDIVLERFGGSRRGKSILIKTCPIKNYTLHLHLGESQNTGVYQSSFEAVHVKLGHLSKSSLRVPENLQKDFNWKVARFVHLATDQLTIQGVLVGEFLTHELKEPPKEELGYLSKWLQQKLEIESSTPTEKAFIIQSKLVNGFQLFVPVTFVAKYRALADSVRLQFNYKIPKQFLPAITKKQGEFREAVVAWFQSIGLGFEWILKDKQCNTEGSKRRTEKEKRSEAYRQATTQE